MYLAGMNTVVVILVFSVGLAWPLGRYMARVYEGKKTLLDCLAPVEQLIFKVSGLDTLKEMDWKRWLGAFFSIHIFWFIWSMLILTTQKHWPLNPTGAPSMNWTLALNATVSFLTSTNVQHYVGESDASYFSQVTVFMFLQFASAAASLAAGIAVVRGIKSKSSATLGNFYRDFVLSLTRVLIPLSILTSVIFLFRGVPMTFTGPAQVQSLQKDFVSVARGPVAAFEPIKELGSNGGGFFNANDAHPFENPDAITFIVHATIVFLIPIAFVFLIGTYLDEKKFSLVIFFVMLIGFLFICIPVMVQETRGNPAVERMGVAQKAGNLEGKEIRFGSALTAFYCGENVVIPAGTTVGAHDSFMPLSGVFMLLGMQVDAFFGGLGTGWINMFIFILIAIFIATLMIGRTPELLGKKISVYEIQIAAAVLLLQPLICLGSAAIATYIQVHHSGSSEALGWLHNPKYHGFTTILYEYVTCYAGNGSEFAGLGNNSIFWNLSTIAPILIGRFAPIAGAVAISGFMSESKYTPPSMGTLKVDSVSFGFFLFFVILVVQVLSLFPCLALGPIAEHVSMI